MTKCEFCTKSSPSGECYWQTQSLRERDCKKAIETMIKYCNSQNNQQKGKK